MNIFKKTLAAACLCITSVSANAAILNFTANIEGAQEVAPVVTPATGLGVFTLDTDTNEFSWSITIEDYLLTGGQTGAHIHEAAIGTNGGVKINLNSDPGAIVAIDFLKYGSKIISAANASALLAEEWYVNVHTTTNGGGEIRGQIIAVPEPASIALLAIGSVAMITRRKK